MEVMMAGRGFLRSWPRGRGHRGRDAADARRAVGPVTGDSEDIAGLWPDVAANGEEARKLMEEHGYGPNHRLPVKVTTRNIAQYRDPAVILIDQMKQIYIDGELDTVETANWFPKIARNDSMLGANLSGSGVDDPGCLFLWTLCVPLGATYTNYCNPWSSRQ